MVGRVSAIVPCYNAGRYLADTLRGIRSQTIPFEEIIVVDDGSSDNTSAVAAACTCTVIRHTRNRGLAAARNTGIENARSALVACIDADVVLATDWLANLLPEFRDPDVVQGGGRIVERHQSSAADRWRALYMKLDYGDSPRKIDQRSPGRLSGFATLARREALQAVGLYDCRFGRSYEDVDISTRLIDQGYTLSYAPQAICYHNRSDTLQSLLASCWSWAFWPASFEGCYRSAWAVLSKVRGNLSACLERSREHVATGDYALLCIDGSLLILSSIWDIRYYLSLRFSLARAVLGPGHLGNIGSGSATSAEHPSAPA